jgi:hypothetical protein
VVTKLVRLARLPRLIKLIDISRFSKILKSFEKEGGGDDQWIVQQYFILYVYNIMRLIIIAIMITYFIGCIVYFISNEFNTEEDLQSGNTFNQAFGLENLDSDKSRLIVCCYFALTMLATVGYGDYYPISSREMIAAVIIMLACVAIFSFIMSSFLEIISSYNQKMDTVDKSEELDRWLISLERYTKGTPLNLSLINDITADVQYFNSNDRVNYLKNGSVFSQLPEKIVKEMVADFIFADIFLQYKRFFRMEFLKEKEFLYDVAMGFMPRRFDHSNPVDKIIYEEDQEVVEMYFVLNGQIGYAINALQMKHTGSFYKIGRRQKGRQLICDHYAINKKKSKFIYIALEDCDCFALSSKYFEKVIFPKNQEIEAELRSACHMHYKLAI